MSDPWEDIAYTLPERLDAAFSSEHELVREAAGQGLVWVVIVDAGRPLEALGLRLHGVAPAVLVPGLLIGPSEYRKRYRRHAWKPRAVAIAFCGGRHSAMGTRSIRG